MPPTEEADEGDKDDFYQTLTTEVTKIRQQYGNSIIIMGDFNARVGTLTGFEHSDVDILGPFGIPDANRLNINGALLRNFLRHTLAESGRHILCGRQRGLL